jgi:heptosyltransferase-1
VNSILFVRLSAMGDLVQSLGAVAALLAVRPGLRATIVTQEPLVPLLEGFPGLARVVGFRRDGGLAGLRRVRDELRRDGYDVALDLQGNWKSAMVACLSGARHRLGARGAGRRERWSRLLLDRTVAIDGVPHPARVAWQLVREIEPQAAFTLPRLVATAAEVESERAAVRAAGVDPERPFRLVVVTDPRDPRALRADVVAASLRDGHLPVLQVMGPDEAGLLAAAGFPLVRHGRDELRRLIALGEVVAAAGGRVLGPDQGAVHVLAAAGARCTVVFGAQDPRRTAPPAASAIVHPKPPTCSPCRSRRCSHPEGPVCMEFDPATGREVPTGLPSPSP